MLVEGTGGVAASASVARLWRHELRATTVLALPLVGSQLAAIAIATTDVVMMGWLGPAPLAAGALGGTLYMPVMHFGFGVIAAVAPLAAQALGAGDFAGVRRSVQQGLWVGLALAAVFFLPLWYSGAILQGFGQASALAELAQGYLRAALWGLAPLFWLIVLRDFLTVQARPRAVFLVMLAGIAVNALGNYALMFGHFGFPRLELVGAGISTAMVDWFMALALLAFVLGDRRLRGYRLLRVIWRADWRRFYGILRLGIPIGLTVLAESSLFAAAGLLMGLIGTAELAAHAIALQCTAVAFMVPLGISHAVTARVGLAAGAGDRAAVGRAGWAAVLVGIACTSVSAGVFLFAGKWLVGFFLDPTVADIQSVTDLAITFLIIAALFQLADGSQAIGVGALRGLRDTRVPLCLAVFGYWVIGINASVILAFPLGFGGAGIWMGLAIGLSIVAVLAIWRFHRRQRLLPAPAH